MSIVDPAPVVDEVSVALSRPRGIDSPLGLVGEVVAELYGPDGELKTRVASSNLVTAVGDQLYASRGAGLTSSAVPTGMKLGTGDEPVTKTGAGAALETYLTGSNVPFDNTYPQVAGGVATYRCTWDPGEGTSASPITEAVIVTETITNNDTSTAAETVSRVLLAGIGSKGAGDTLILTWTHTVLGA